MSFTFRPNRAAAAATELVKKAFFVWGTVYAETLTTAADKSQWQSSFEREKQ